LLLRYKFDFEMKCPFNHSRYIQHTLALLCLVWWIYDFFSCTSFTVRFFVAFFCAIRDAALKVIGAEASPSQSTGSIVPLVAAPDWLLYLLIATIVVGMVSVFCSIRREEVKNGWSLSDALSDEVMRPGFKESVDPSCKTSKVRAFDADD
jgi:hypothetical protein